MRRYFVPLLWSLIGTAAPRLAYAANEVAADHNPLPLGETVTLRWYFTGDKVTVSGGRFGAGVVVTGKTMLTDKPTHTTRYTFDSQYKGKGPAKEGEEAKIVPLHVKYSVLVEVYDPKTEGLLPYVDPHGWKVAVLKTWKRDSVPLPDPANNALMYFQQEDDAVDRLAVAILPVSDGSLDPLVAKIEADLPSHYDKVELGPRKDLFYEGQPAVFGSFTGMDNTHPGTKTQTVYLAFTRGGRAYVISARTASSRFALRQRVMQYMVKSFCFAGTGVSAATR